jgi:hypothetical protein
MFGTKIKVIKLTARISDYDSSSEANGAWVFKNITLIDEAGDKVFFRHLNISKDDYALLQKASPTPVTLYAFTMPIDRSGGMWAEVYAVKHGEVRSMRRGAHKASRMMALVSTKRYMGMQVHVQVFVYAILWGLLWYAGYQYFDQRYVSSQDVMVYSGLLLLAVYLQPLFFLGAKGRYRAALALVSTDGFSPTGENWRAGGNSKYV